MISRIPYITIFQYFNRYTHFKFYYYLKLKIQFRKKKLKYKCFETLYILGNSNMKCCGKEIIRIFSIKILQYLKHNYKSI